MSNSEQKVVSVIYELTTSRSNGEVIEKVTEENPLTFISGTGNLLPAFEEQLSSLSIGDSFDFSIPCDDAYGQPNDKAIIDLPVDAFFVDGKIDEELVQLGNVVPMRDQAGNRLNGKVIGIDSESVKMDFNHPLAGDDLHFQGNVVGVRAATEEEIAHGHIHNHSDHSCESGNCGEEGGCGEEGHSCNCH
jgi:FKBP-type peptidyl-prolyl cis-trans isomerase SlyD